ncbi:hypothetical protein CEXT_756681 [Caerostris extrusa]|uniref:Uncharacterized protein n=1 Tax=Caerostris extrusa TaxID=172846 RepID=A0AAV4PD70_CAEEX|nr:hypothetical protein CEXT_756681 [Caerostris extrusa]
MTKLCKYFPEVQNAPVYIATTDYLNKDSSTSSGTELLFAACNTIFYKHSLMVDCPKYACIFKCPRHTNLDATMQINGDLLCVWESLRTITLYGEVTLAKIIVVTNVFFAF